MSSILVMDFDYKVKDIDWVSQGRKLLLTPPDMARFKAYLEKDVAVSKKIVTHFLQRVPNFREISQIKILKFN